MVQKVVLASNLKKKKHLSYLFDMITKVLSTRTTRNNSKIPLFNVNHEYFWNSFFPSTVIEWKKLDNNIRNSESVSTFKKQILRFNRPSPNGTFNVHNPHGIKLLTRLRVVLSDLCEYKFRHSFQESLDPICNCDRHIETTINFFLHCSDYKNQRKTLFENIINIKRSSLNQNDSLMVETLLFGSNGLNEEENAWIMESTIEYIINTERFITPLLWIPLSKSPFFLESLIDSGWLYVKLFSCLTVDLYK